MNKLGIPLYRGLDIASLLDQLKEIESEFPRVSNKRTLEHIRQTAFIYPFITEERFGEILNFQIEAIDIKYQDVSRRLQPRIAKLFASIDTFFVNQSKLDQLEEITTAQLDELKSWLEKFYKKSQFIFLFQRLKPYQIVNKPAVKNFYLFMQQHEPGSNYSIHDHQSRYLLLQDLMEITIHYTI